MKIKPFKLERYFAKYEFTAKYLLSCSDCEALKLQEVLEMADSETKQLWDNLKLAYTESAGHPLLKEEVAQLHTSIQPDDINVMVPEEAIFVSMNCQLEKGDHVVCTFPGYQSLYEIASSLECRVDKWIPEFREKEWHFNLEKLKSLVRENTKLIVVNFPHNPTGATVSENDFNAIADFCRQRSILLFSDEMYRFLEYDENHRLPSASDLYENAISLFGMSKSFALPGLRIGWLTSRNKKLMQKIAEFKDYTTICNNAPGEILAIIALRNKEIIIKRNLEIIHTNLQLLDRFFSSHSEKFEWKAPKAGPIAFPLLKNSITISDFCQELVEKKSTMLLPASVYGFQGNYFRIGFARKDLANGLERLENFLLQQ